MMRFVRSGTGLMGFVFAAILILWFTLAGIRTAEVTNPLGVVGGNNVILIGILLLVASGTYWVGEKRLSGRFISAASGEKTGNEEDVLESLKRRYVAGEIDEAAFERRLETLFETETVEDAKRRVENTLTAPESTQKSQTVIPGEVGPPQATTRQVRRRNTRFGHDRCK